METTSIFLGSKGLSQSEANHTANVAKEIAEGFGSEIHYMSLFKKTLNDKFGKTPYNHVKVVEGLEEKCLEEGSIYALSAWLREGIKAKANIIKNIQTMGIHQLCELMGLSLPDEAQHPVMQALPREEQMVEHLSIAERAEYLSCEAKAAHIGKKIHPGGLIPSWRKMLANMSPVEMIQGPGSNEYLRVDIETIIIPEKVDALFYMLQRKHREMESRVNYYKAKLHNLFNEETVRINTENSKLLQEYSSKVDTFNNELRVIQSKAEAHRAIMLRDASDLKVIVPESLQGVLDLVQLSSKKK